MPKQLGNRKIRQQKTLILSPFGWRSRRSLSPVTS